MENQTNPLFSKDLKSENISKKVQSFIEEQMNLIYELRDMASIANTIVQGQQRQINHLKNLLDNSFETVCETLKRDYHTDFLN